LIALDNKTYLEVIDVTSDGAGLPKLTVTGQIPLSHMPYDLAIDEGSNKLWISPSKNSTPRTLSLFELNSASITSSQALSPVWPEWPETTLSLSGDDKLLLDTNNNVLYISTTHVSPTTLIKVDLSNILLPIPELKERFIEMTTADFELNSNGSLLYVAGGIGSENPLLVLNTSDLSIEKQLPLGNFPRAVAIDGTHIYAGSDQEIKVYDSTTDLLVKGFSSPHQESFLKKSIIPGYALTNGGLYKLNMATGNIELVYDYLPAGERLLVELTIEEGGSVKTIIAAKVFGTCDTPSCIYEVRKGSVIKFEALVQVDSDFSEWTSHCSNFVSFSLTCGFVVWESDVMTAKFSSGEPSETPNQDTYTLTVKKDGTGAGRVTTSDGSMDCGVDQAECSVELPKGTTVSLYVWPEIYSSFRVWEGDDCLGTIGTAICNVTMDKDEVVTGTFYIVDSQIQHDVEITNYLVNVLSDSSVSLSWTTDPTLNCTVVYSRDSRIKDDVIDSAVQKTIVPVYRERAYTATNLDVKALYYFTVVCRDHASNEKKAQSYITSVTTLFTQAVPDKPDSSASNPVLSSIATTPSTHQVIITWKTDISASSNVHYGLTRSFSSLEFMQEKSSLVKDHKVIIGDLKPETTYYFRLEGETAEGASYTSGVGKFKTVQDPNIPAEQEVLTPIKEEESTRAPTSEEEQLQKRIIALKYLVSELETQLVENERKLVELVDENLVERTKGKILLQVEGNGEAWYVDSVSSKKYYLRDGETAYAALQAFGLGISNADLEHIPLGYDERFEGEDSDNDGLMDKLEEAIGTDPLKNDSDGDSFTDGQEVRNGFNPLGSGRANNDDVFGSSLEGRIVLQVESRGEAWYIYNGKRYYLGNGQQAYQVMRFLSLGVTNADLRKIGVGDFAQ
jgi:hypothetical protein